MQKSNPNAPVPFTRRAFLGNLAVAGGVAAGTPLLAQASGWSGSSVASGKLRIGVVPPVSSDELDVSWLNGLRLAFAGASAITLDIAAPAALPGRVAAQARRFADAGADLVIGAVTPAAASQVDLALRGTPALFLNVEAGGHLPRPNDFQTRVYHHTLQLWQANYAAGSQAAQALGRRAGVLSSYRESGYDTATAFVAGFESAGGTISGTAVSHVPGSPADPRQLAAQLRAGGADFIYVNASGREAVELLAAAGAGAVAAPMAQARGEVDAEFARSYQDASGRPVDAFALLGYEAGKLVLAAAAASTASGASFAASLARAGFDGPRGAVRMDAELHATTATAYVASGAGVLSGLTPVAERLALSHPGWNQAISGWALPYAGATEQSRA